MNLNNKQANRVIIFSHGFGVRKDSRGIFTEITSWFPESKSILFDYNQILDENTTVVSRFYDQANKFNEVLVDTIRENPEAEIFIIAHSQGAMPVALNGVDSLLVKKIILLAPVTITDINKTIQYFKKYPNTQIDLDGESVLERKDGSKTIVPKEFWIDKQKHEPIPLYNKLAQTNNTIIVFADQDDVLVNHIQNLSEDIEIIHVNADHNFTGESRNELKKVLFKVID